MDGFAYHAPEVKETEKFYKRALWWIGHRESLRHVGLVTWVVLDAILVLFAVWVMVDAFLLSYETERGALRSLLVDNATTTYEQTRVGAAKPLRIEGAPLVLSAGDGTYDFVGVVTNPNTEWWAEVLYQMTYGEEETEPAFAVVYPGETRALSALRIETTRSADVKLRLPTLRWHRIDPHAIPDFESWKRDRFNFPVTDARFETITSGSTGSVGRSSFAITNRTAFGYWSVPLTILLKRGGAIIGVSTTSVSQLEAGEERAVELNWFQTFPSVDEILVVPTLNIFDPSVFMPPKGEGSLDTRDL